MKMKKILLSIIVLIIIIGIGFAIVAGGNKKKSNAKYKVLASNFASYDFLRAIIGDNKDVELEFLLGPGKDAHSYDPTAQDLIKIQDSDLFVYVGGEMEKWSDKVMDSIDTTEIEVICMADFVETMEEKEVDGAEESEHEHGEEDEHHEESDEHEDTGCNSRVDDVLTNTAKQLLNNYDGGEAADYGDPERKACRQVQCEQSACQDRTQVTDCLLFLSY